MIKCNIKVQLVGGDFESRPHLAIDSQEQRDAKRRNNP